MKECKARCVKRWGSLRSFLFEHHHNKMQKKYFVCCSFIDLKKNSRNISSFCQLTGHLRKTREIAALKIVVNQRLSLSTVLHAIAKLENRRGEGIQTSKQSGLNITVPCIWDQRRSDDTTTKSTLVIAGCWPKSNSRRECVRRWYFHLCVYYYVVVRT